MILHDPYAVHRKWWDWEWEPTPGKDEAWTDWDFILAEVYQLIGDYTDKNTNQWIPYDQSPEVWWDVKSIHSGSEKALEIYKKSHKMEPGEFLYVVPVFGETKPTLASWAEQMDAGHLDGRPAGLQDSRPPTAEELAAMGAE